MDWKKWFLQINWKKGIEALILKYKKRPKTFLIMSILIIWLIPSIVLSISMGRDRVPFLICFLICFFILFTFACVAFIIFSMIYIITTHIKAVHSRKCKPWNIALKLLWICIIFISIIAGVIIAQINNFSFLLSCGIFVLSIILGSLCFQVYFLPYLIANEKRHLQETAIFVVNLFAAWTLLGWIVALVWSYTKEKTETKTSYRTNSVEEQLEKSWHLYQQGIISYAEFEKRKNFLLNSEK